MTHTGWHLSDLTGADFLMYRVDDRTRYMVNLEAKPAFMGGPYEVSTHAATDATVTGTASFDTLDEAIRYVRDAESEEE